MYTSTTHTRTCTCTCTHALLYIIHVHSTTCTCICTFTCTHALLYIIHVHSTTCTCTQRTCTHCIIIHYTCTQYYMYMYMYTRIIHYTCTQYYMYMYMYTRIIALLYIIHVHSTTHTCTRGENRLEGFVCRAIEAKFHPSKHTCTIQINMVIM